VKGTHDIDRREVAAIKLGSSSGTVLRITRAVSMEACTQEGEVQSQGCFSGFHGSLPCHLIEKVLNLITSNVQRDSDVFKIRSAHPCLR